MTTMTRSHETAAWNFGVQLPERRSCQKMAVNKNIDRHDIVHSSRNIRSWVLSPRPIRDAA
jgi:hypothetical protein